MNKDFIIAEIKRLAAENGGMAPGKSAFFNATGIKESDWTGKIWVRWSDAVRDAGFEPQEMQRPLDDGEKIRRLIEVIRHYRKWPTTAEIKFYTKQTNGFPSHNTLSGLGNLNERKQLVRDYCKNEKDQYQDILSIIPDQTLGHDDENHIGNISRNKKDTVVGYVYLMKSGKYYKIERSVCAEKRHYELGIQLPEKLKLMHKIATDDPPGIEAYWHNRFKSKRLNGEWFQLTREDIIAFKRRSYM
jgi:hypothetical protein